MAMSTVLGSATSTGIFDLVIVVFATTNIDNNFVLVSFLADPDFGLRNVAMGEYRGISVLISVSHAVSSISVIIVRLCEPAWVIVGDPRLMKLAALPNGGYDLYQNIPKLNNTSYSQNCVF
jgi:hypothetical protein